MNCSYIIIKYYYNMNQTIIVVLVLIILVALFNKNKERFDGVGKGFGMYYHPGPCCKSKSCYPGMYLGNDFWIQNWFY